LSFAATDGIICYNITQWSTFPPSETTMADSARLFPLPEHDHRACVADGLAHAETICADAQARLTDNRRAVFEILLVDHVPLSAYEIADRIDWKGRRAAPVQVYRALEFLADLGLVHRIESLNAFLACSRPGDSHGAQFLVCTDCRRVAEASDTILEKGIRRLADSAGFQVHAPVIEVAGLCPDCAGERRA
jgi:Fur family zinc uptake transcriptional regulator